jgi:thioredoxin reductase
VDTFDAVVVGAGPAGLSAALILGRCRRRVLVCDAGHSRNAVSHALHGFLTRDGIEPAELRRVGREQLRRYPTVEVRDIEVVDAKCEDHGFVVTLINGTALSCRKLLLATGVSDQLPRIEGFQTFYGRSVFHCPYCDGWEVRDQPLAIYGSGEHGTGLALELTAWSADLVLCTDGAPRLDRRDVDRLACHGIGLREDPIARLEGRDGVLERIVFTTGDALERRAMFFSTGASGVGSRGATRMRIHGQGCRPNRRIRDHECSGLVRRRRRDSPRPTRHRRCRGGSGGGVRDEHRDAERGPGRA